MNPTILVRSSLLAVLIQAAVMSPATAAVPAAGAQAGGVSVTVDNGTGFGAGDMVLAAANSSPAGMAFMPAGLDARARSAPSPSVADDDSLASMPAPVPERSTWAMLLAGVAGVMVLKRHLLRRRS